MEVHVSLVLDSLVTFNFIFVIFSEIKERVIHKMPLTHVTIDILTDSHEFEQSTYLSK